MINMSTPSNGPEIEFTHLRDLDLSGLRARWHSAFRRKAPAHLPRHLLYRILAYRLQAEQLGDLEWNIRRFLDQVAAGTSNGAELPITGNRNQQSLRTGTVLVREWNGMPQRVTVLDQGFSWNGTTFRSLTEIARAITGTRWSGPRFFGLRDRGEKTA